MRNWKIFLLPFCLLSNLALADIQIGECQARSQKPVFIHTPSSISSFPYVLEFQCHYSCRLNDLSVDEMDITYKRVIESDREDHSQMSCEGDHRNQFIFFSRLSKSEEIRLWARANKIDYEGPYQGRLTQETLVKLAEVGQKLSGLKSYYARQAGIILLDIANKNARGVELFDRYLEALREGNDFPGIASYSDDYVIFYLKIHARHLY